MRGLFLALEGTDGAGKSSQLARLSDYFTRCGRTIATLHFPRLDVEPYGEMIAAFLRGEYGPLDAVHPRLAALIYALDRKEAAPSIRALLDNGSVFIADRYLFSNIAYQCAKTADPAERDALALWIETLEYRRHAIPRPDLTLFLDAPLPFVLQRLNEQRGGADREYLRGKRDIHEASDTLQTRVRNEYARLAASRPDELVLIDCRDGSGDMADADIIHNRILDILATRGIVR